MKNGYAVCLENITFGYANHMVLNNLNLEADEGAHIGIIGDSGCGKSTFLKMLAGLYEPDGGKRTVAGEYAAEGIRQKVALVMQNNSLFPLSIRENITCGHDVPVEVLLRACRGASLMQWIETLPQGLDTNVGERGAFVSGGQAQRIQIARALCKDAPVILLDEPTSALDKETEASVLSTLHEQMGNKTIIHITHHPEALDGTYLIYRMEGGKLIRE